MARTKKFIVQKTNGSKIEYTYSELYEIVKAYMEKYVKDFPTAADIDAFIPTFLARFKKVDDNKCTEDESTSE